MFQTHNLAGGGPVDCNLAFEGNGKMLYCETNVWPYIVSFQNLRAFLTIVDTSFLSVEDSILDDALILQ